MLNLKNTLDFTPDPFTEKCIETFLSKTIGAETRGITFDVLLENTFTKLNHEEYEKAFETFDKDTILDLKWLDSTMTIINSKKYPTYRIVGGVYLQSIIIDFVIRNRIILINSFVVKYCKEKEIRKSLMDKLLNSSQLTTETIGILLGELYRKELALRKEEQDKTEIVFSVYSKEATIYELPALDPELLYSVVIKPGDGVANIQENNKLEFIPPVVLKETLIYAEILVNRLDGFIKERRGINIKVLPQRYHPPVIGLQSVAPSNKLTIDLPEVESDYVYTAIVPEGFGVAEILNEKTLEYTAPIHELDQYVAIRVVLKWNSKFTIYDTTIDVKVKSTIP